MSALWLSDRWFCAALHSVTDACTSAHWKLVIFMHSIGFFFAFHCIYLYIWKTCCCCFSLWCMQIDFTCITLYLTFLIHRTTKDTFEPPHDKTNNVVVCPAKTQIRLGIRPVWSESSLSAWRKLGSLATHWVRCEDSDQTGCLGWSESSLGAHSLCWFCHEAARFITSCLYCFAAMLWSILSQKHHLHNKKSVLDTYGTYVY